MLLTVTHTTRYDYAVPATYALLQMRVQPRSSAVQVVKAWQVELSGARLHASFSDQFGNLVDLIELDPGARRVDISVSGTVETLHGHGVLERDGDPMPMWYYHTQSALTAPGPMVSAVAAQMGDITGREIEGLHHLSHLIRSQVDYVPGTTGVATSAEQALVVGSGVCQDHAHIFLSAARLLGFPARYVSGYLLMDDRVDQDAGHAWAEVHVAQVGWIGFDVSNGISPDQRYIRVAHGLDYRDAAPTTGIMTGGQQEKLVVSIQVQQ